MGAEEKDLIKVKEEGNLTDEDYEDLEPMEWPVFGAEDRDYDDEILSLYDDDDEEEIVNEN